MKYLYYYLKASQEKIYNLRTKAGVPAINQAPLAEFKVFIPSEIVQQRIVDILDRFDTLCSDLTNGLPAEIEARRKQYEYYRDKLLTFQPLKQA